MYKILFSFLVMLFMNADAKAQLLVKVSGNVINKNDQPVQNATVTLLRAKDSGLVKTAIADKAGKYEFVNIKPGNYLVAASSTAFAKTFSNTFEVGSQTVEVLTLSLAEAVQQLTGVNVNAKRPFIETLLDKTVVNVEASPSSAGATVMDVLEKSPGIIVNNEGVISLAGKQGVIVMVDGKPSNLTAADLANMLRNMPASAMEQIEIMTNPSSKYDASGNSGIINLKTKKGKDPGWNGTITAGLSVSINKFYDKTDVFVKSPGSFNFNYRKKKVNIFGNYNPNYFTGETQLELDKIFFYNRAITGYSYEDIRFKMKSFSNTIKAGLDLYADKKNIFGIVFNGYLLNGSPKQLASILVQNAAKQKQSDIFSLSENDLRFENFNTNLNWKHTFDTTGRELTIDADYVGYSNISKVLLTTDYYNATGQFISRSLLRGNLPATINIYSFKSDYTKPFKNGRLEMGVKFSYVRNDNSVKYERLINNSWKEEPNSNRFIYDENINAAYINVNKKINKWTLQGGLRLESTIAKGKQVTANKNFKRDSLNLFPTAFIGYAINKNNQLNFSYGRRINRPNYQELNPFVLYIDSLSYRVGNPALKPQYSQNFELGYVYRNKYSAKLNYSHTKDVITQMLAADIITQKTFMTTKNAADFKNMGVAIALPLTITKKWGLNLFSNIFNNHYKGIYNADTSDLSLTSFTITASNAFTLSKTFTLEVSGFYRHKGMEGITFFDPTYQMSIAAQKQIIKGRGTLRINFRDPFAWQKFKTTNYYKDLTFVHAGHGDARQFTATFTYRFGKNNLQPRRRNAATQEEQNRIGGL